LYILLNTKTLHSLHMSFLCVYYQWFIVVKTFFPLFYGNLSVHFWLGEKRESKERVKREGERERDPKQELVVNIIGNNTVVKMRLQFSFSNVELSLNPSLLLFVCYLLYFFICFTIG
jgi:hypothetical protein